MRPNTACEVSHNSRNHYKARKEILAHGTWRILNQGKGRTRNSKKPTIPTKANTCTINATIEPNFAQHDSIIGPMNNDTKN